MFLNVIKHNNYVREIQYRAIGVRKRTVEAGRSIPRGIRSAIFWRRKVREEDVELPKLGKEVKLSYRKFVPCDAAECSLILLENNRIIREEEKYEGESEKKRTQVES